MKPAAFKYVAATSLAHALRTLGEGGDEAKVLAGGQSLVPMMNFRLVRPSVLVDVNRVDGLAGIAHTPDGVRIGAMTRHRETATSPLIASLFPIVAEAMAHVAHVTVRNRGTFGGSLAHADPAAELPMLALLLGATIEAASEGGTRRIAAADFFVSALTTSLRPGEIVTAIEVPLLPPGTGWGFAEFARRHGDYALAAVGVTLRAEHGHAANVRVAAMGVGDTPLRLTAAEAALEGRVLDNAALDDAYATLDAALHPNGDLNASPAYRRHLARVLLRRAAACAWARAAGTDA